MLKLLSEMHEQAAQELRDRGVDLLGYNTEAAAEDIDAVRAALGYEKINLLGRSYGSHLSFTVMRRHGAHLNRVLIVGPEGFDHTLKRPGQIQEGLERVYRLVANDEYWGAKVPDLVGLIEQVLVDLETNPREVSHTTDKGELITVGISKFDVQRYTAHAIGRRPSMAPLPKAFYQMARGDFGYMAGVVVQMRTIHRISGMATMTYCMSGITPERLARIERELPDCLLGDTVNFPYFDLCKAWGSPDLGEAFRRPLESDVPVLFYCGTIDSRTPPSNAIEIMEGLPNARMIEVINAGHEFKALNDKEGYECALAFLRGEDFALSQIELPAPAFDTLD